MLNTEISGIRNGMYICYMLLLGIFSACVPEDEFLETNYVPATIKTNAATSVTASSAYVSAVFSAPQDRTITWGICASRSQNPTTEDIDYHDDAKLGSYSVFFYNLQSSTTYYARAYTINGQGKIYYGNQVNFTTLSNVGYPVLTTTDVTSITATTAISGGNITSNGGYTVTVRGVCWNTTGNPTTSNSKTTDGSGNGIFTSSITGLAVNTTYYVRAYATNSVGTAYGFEVSFTTKLNAWTTKTSMPTARYSMGIAVLNNKIYVIGGIRNGSTVVDVAEYNPATDIWTTKPNMSVARDPAAATVGNYIYVIGDDVTTQKYDPVNNTWTTMASMPTTRQPFVAVVNNKIYATGGYNTISGSLSTNEEYNPSTNVWTSKTSMPTARNSSTAAAANSLVYAIGGEYSMNSPYAIVEEYNPTTNTWTTKTSMPTARRAASAVTINNKIYVVGGSNTINLTTVELFDPITNTWTTKAPMQIARGYVGIALVNNKIYVIGGLNDTGALTTVEEYDPSLDQ